MLYDDIPSAFRHLKGSLHQPLQFLFCEKGENGKPLLIVAKPGNKITPKDRKEALGKAKPTGLCLGQMEMDDNGAVNVTPRGKASGKLLMGLTRITHENHCAPKAIIIKKAGPEEPEDTEEDTSEETSLKTEGVPPPPPVPPGKPPAPPPQVSDNMKARIKKSLAAGARVEFATHPEVQPLLAAREETRKQLNDVMHGPNVSDETLAPVVEKLEQIDQTISTKVRGLRGSVQAPGDMDVVRNDEVIRELRSKKEAIAQRREDLEDKLTGNSGDSESRKQLEEANAELAKVDQELRARLLHLVGPGFKGKQLGEEYIGESDVQGTWRARPGTTKYYTEEERQSARLRTDDEGRLRDSENESTPGKRGFVMNTQGELHKFKVNETEEVGNSGLTKQTFHSSVLAGGDVAGAGEMEVDSEGKISKISNRSGHYKPGAVQMIQTVEELLKQGALLDKEWVTITPDSEGRTQPLSGEAKKIYEAAMKLQSRLLDPDSYLTEDRQDKPAMLKAIEKAKQMLTKLGYAPSNRVSPAMVEFLTLRQDMQGGDVVKKVVGEEMTVPEFLRSGAGNKEQLDSKLKMQDQLKEKLAKRKQDLDEEAERRAKEIGGGARPTDPPSEEERQQMVAELEKYAETLRSAPDYEDWKDTDIELTEEMIERLGIKDDLEEYNQKRVKNGEEPVKSMSPDEISLEFVVSKAEMYRNTTGFQLVKLDKSLGEDAKAWSEDFEAFGAANARNYNYLLERKLGINWEKDVVKPLRERQQVAEVNDQVGGTDAPKLDTGNEEKPKTSNSPSPYLTGDEPPDDDDDDDDNRSRYRNNDDDEKPIEPTFNEIAELLGMNTKALFRKVFCKTSN